MDIDIDPRTVYLVGSITIAIGFAAAVAYVGKWIWESKKKSPDTPAPDPVPTQPGATTTTRNGDLTKALSDMNKKLDFLDRDHTDHKQILIELARSSITGAVHMENIAKQTEVQTELLRDRLPKAN